MTRRKTTRLIPATSGDPYTAEDQLGDVMELFPFEGAGPANIVIDGITIIDVDSQSPQLVLFFFTALPALGSTDNEAFALSDAEGVKLAGQVVHDDLRNNSAGSVQIQTFNFRDQPGGIPLPAAARIYVAIKVVNTPTFSSPEPLLIDVHYRME